MTKKYFFLALTTLLSLQGQVTAKSEGPVIPRLQYSFSGRHLDFPESITFFLAEYNSQGFPNDLFYRSLEDATDLSHQPSMGEIAVALRSPDVQHSVEEAALDHFADVLNEPEAHYALEESGKEQQTVCTYSWLSWLPWLDCPTESSRSTTGQVIPQKEVSAQCFAPKSVYLKN